VSGSEGKRKDKKAFVSTAENCELFGSVARGLFVYGYHRHAWLINFAAVSDNSLPCFEVSLAVSGHRGVWVCSLEQVGSVYDHASMFFFFFFLFLFVVVC
jgi:hypothetical protein